MRPGEIGPVDERGARAVEEAKAMLAIVEVMAPLNHKQRRVVLAAVRAQLDADIQADRARQLFDRPTDFDSAFETVEEEELLRRQR